MERSDYEKMSAQPSTAKDPTSTEQPPSFSQSMKVFQAQTYRTQFASLSMHMHDRLRTLDLPQELIPDLRNVIKSSWPKGIQAERPYGGSHEFKMYGNPWSYESSESVSSRLLVRDVLAFLFANGWILSSTMDVSKKHRDNDLLIFRKQENVPPESVWASISLFRGDRMRVIGKEAQGDVVSGFRDVIVAARLLQREHWQDHKYRGVAWEFKLNGYPWKASGEETMVARSLILKLLACLDGLGWSLYATIDQNTESSDGDSSETDVWYIVKSKDWCPGLPVFHK